MTQKRVVIMGAAGRDFHNFNVVYRNDPDVRVVAFTATQTPHTDRRSYPPELAGPLYPEGIPIVPESSLDALIRKHSVDEAVFAYGDVTHEFVMRQASRVLAVGAKFSVLGPNATAISSEVPVISVLGTRAGAGKSPTSRFVASLLMAHGVTPTVIRYPIPHGDLASQKVQRFHAHEDSDRQPATVEEREDYEPHIRRGLVVWAGVDYEAVVAEAEKDASVIIWDGGNNDFSFLRSDLEIVVVDPMRTGHGVGYHPGEMNLRRADIAVVSKVNSAFPHDVDAVVENIRELNQRASIVRTDTVVSASNPAVIKGKKVLVVEDGPMLEQGGMGTGAGMEAARRFEAETIVNPRPYVQGELADTYSKYPDVGPILPTVGYYSEQLEDLEATINSVPADVVVSATPFSLGSLLHLNKPLVQITYELSEREEPRLSDLVRSFLWKQGLAG